MISTFVLMCLRKISFGIYANSQKRTYAKCKKKKKRRFAPNRCRDFGFAVAMLSGSWMLWSVYLVAASARTLFLPPAAPAAARPPHAWSPRGRQPVPRTFPPAAPGLHRERITSLVGQLPKGIPYPQDSPSPQKANSRTIFRDTLLAYMVLSLRRNLIIKH